MLLEGMGRAIASNPMTPFGRARRWLKEVARMPKGTIREDYPTLPSLHRLITAIAREELQSKELTPDTAKIHTIKPSPRSVQLLRQACQLSKTVTPGGACWLDSITSYMAFLNELSALVHVYEALTQPVSVGDRVYASEDARERFIKTALRWRKAVKWLHSKGLLLSNPDLFFAIALKDRVDLRNGESPGHLTKLSRTFALYTDGDLDVVWTMGEIHKRLGKKAPLLSHSKPSLNEFYFPVPDGDPATLWAVPNGLDLRNLLFMRLFHDTVKLCSRSCKLSKIYETAQNILKTYEPMFERKALVELTGHLLSEAVEVLSVGIHDYLHEADRKTKREIFEQAVGRASAVLHHEILKTMRRELS